MTKFCVIDATNLLYRAYYVNKDETEDMKVSLAQFSALLTVNKYYTTFNPDTVVLLFDRPNWRKPYTKSDLCVSQKLYKGGRRKNMTQSEREKFKAFLEHIGEFESMMKKHSSVVCLSAPLLEADDLAGGFVEQYTSNTNEIILVSTDKDYIQLLGNKNVRLINPATGKDRTLDDWDGDAELFMFEKCIRGEPGSGDNVQSAFPRCRRTRIHKAYKDPLEYTNLMHETWKHPDGRTMIVKELFHENQLLMNLTKQPIEIKEIIQSTITTGMKNTGTFSHFHFLRFCGKYGLKKLAGQIEQFIPLLNS